MLWLIVAIIAYFIQAGVAAADKVILTKSFPSVISYAFWVGVFSIFNVLLLLMSWDYPGPIGLGIDILIGIIWLIAVISLYRNIKAHETSRVITIVGAFTPIFILILSYLFLGELLSYKQLIALALLVLGIVFLSFKKTKLHKIKKAYKRFHGIFFTKEDILTKQLFIGSLTTAALFSVYYILIKFAFMNQPFISAYAWTRLGGFLAAIGLLLFPSNWKVIFARPKGTKKQAAGLFLGTKIAAGISFLMIHYAVAIGSVTIVNALQGVQYAFLLLIVILLSLRYPKVLKEEITKETIAQKILGIIFIGAGLIVLVV